MIKQLAQINPSRWARTFVDYVFGYDFFISYKQSDGRFYPRQLSERLKHEGFKVFLDQGGYVPGDELIQATRRQVKKSSYLLLIARPGAMTSSDWVKREIQVSIEAGNTPIVLNINGAFLSSKGTTEAEAERALTLRSLLQDRLRIEEVKPTINAETYDGQPSEEVIQELKRSFAAKRQDSRRARAFGLAALVFAVLAVAAGLFAWQSYVARRQAERQARRARAGELAAQSRFARTRQPQLAVLLATEAVHTAMLADKQDVMSANQALLESVTGITGHGLTQHADEVLSVSFSPDNKWLATGGRDKTAILWNLSNVDSGSGVMLSDPGAEEVSFVSFSPDSHWLVTAGVGGTFSLWGLADRGISSHSRLTAPGTESLRSFVFSSDARWLAAASDGDQVWLWDLTIPDPTSSPKRIGEGLHTVRDLTFSPRGRWLVGVGITTNDFWVWDFSKTDAIASPRVFHGHSSPVSLAAISDQQNVLASTDDDGNLILWDLGKVNSGKKLFVSNATRPIAIWGLSFSHDGTWLAAALGSASPSEKDVKPDKVLLWRVSGGVSADNPALFEHDSQIRSIAFDPTDRWLYVEGQNGPVKLWEFSGGPAQTPLVLNGHARGVVYHSFSNDGRLLVTGDNQGMANLWDLSCQKTTLVPVPLSGNEAGINDLDISPDGHWVVTAGSDWLVRVWDLRLPVAGEPLVLMRKCSADITSTAVSNDERWFAGGTDDGGVSLYDLSSAEPARTGTLLRDGDGENKVEQLLFSSNSRWLAAITHKGELNVWSLTAASVAQSRRAFHGHEKVGQLISVAFSSDGRNLASADFDGHAWIWDLEAQAPESTKRELRGQGRAIQDIWISPNDRWLLGAAYDELWVWDLARSDHALIPRQLTTHESFIRFVVFSSDSQRMMSVDNNAKARMWRLSAAGIQLEFEFTVDDKHLDKIMFRPRSQDFVSAGLDSGQPRLWTINLDGKGASFRQPAGTIAVTGNPLISANNHWLACSGRNSAQLWKLDEPNKPSRILSSSDSIVSLAFSRDEQHLIYGGESGSVSIVDLSTSGTTSAVSVVGHQGGVQSLFFGAQGRWIISQSYDAVRLWPLRREDLLSLAEYRTGRNLRAGEWTAYFLEEPYRRTFERLVTSRNSQ